MPDIGWSDNVPDRAEVMAQLSLAKRSRRDPKEIKNYQLLEIATRPIDFGPDEGMRNMDSHDERSSMESLSPFDSASRASTDITEPPADVVLPVKTIMQLANGKDAIYDNPSQPVPRQAREALSQALHDARAILNVGLVQGHPSSALAENGAAVEEQSIHLSSIGSAPSTDLSALSADDLITLDNRETLARAADLLDNAPELKFVLLNNTRLKRLFDNGVQPASPGKANWTLINWMLEHREQWAGKVAEMAGDHTKASMFIREMEKPLLLENARRASKEENTAGILEKSPRLQKLFEELNDPLSVKELNWTLVDWTLRNRGHLEEKLNEIANDPAREKAFLIAMQKPFGRM